VTAACAPRRSLAHTWEALYAFGDSYTDSGAGYVDGNGPTAVVYLAQSLNIPFSYAGAADATGKSLNFAISGAQTGKNAGIRIRPATAGCGTQEALFGRGMQTQVADFTQRVRSGEIRFDGEKTVFFLAGGLNDQEVPTATTIGNLEGELRELYRVGGRYFLVALLPTKIPAFTAVGTRLNPAIARVPADVRQKLPGAHIELSRWGQYFDRILNRHAEYGIANAKDRCAGRAIFGETATPCATPDAYFYYHDGHPSTAVQKVVGMELKREIQELFN